MSINIDGSSVPGYRYKMPRILAKVEGRGNGIKTVIPNLALVARALKRPPAQITKFFGSELGALSQYTDATERSVVNGSHSAAELQDTLQRYIRVFVLCPHCNLPETDLKVKHSTSVWHYCRACGGKAQIDPSQRLLSFILSEFKKSKTAATAAESAAAAAAAAAGEGEGEGDAAPAEDGGETAAAAAARGTAEVGDADDGQSDDGGKVKKHKKKKDEKKSSKKSSKKKHARDDADSVDADEKSGPEDAASASASSSSSSSSAAAAAAAAGGAGDAADGGDEAAPATEDDNAAAIDDASQRLARFIEELGSTDADKIVDKANELRVNSCLSKHDALVLIYTATVGRCTPKSWESTVMQFAGVLGLAMSTMGSSGAKLLLASVERHLAGSRYVKYASALLKFLFDAEVLEEKAILKWAKSKKRSSATFSSVSDDAVAAIKAHAQRVVTWLETAEVESADEATADATPTGGAVAEKA